MFGSDRRVLRSPKRSETRTRGEGRTPHREPDFPALVETLGENFRMSKDVKQKYFSVIRRTLYNYGREKLETLKKVLSFYFSSPIILLYYVSGVLSL